MSKINKIIHLDFIKSSEPFEIKCSYTIFISEEINILLKYGNWFSALEKKQLDPFTEKQKQFLNDISNTKLKPKEKYASIWWRYKNRLRLEKVPNFKNTDYKFSREPFLDYETGDINNIIFK